MFWKSKYYKAVDKVKNGNSEEAVLYFEKMIQRKPSYSAKLQYAYFLLQQGNFDKADEVFKKEIFTDARKKKPSEKMLCKVSYAILTWKKGDLDEAVNITEGVYESFKNTTVYINLGFFYILKGDFEKALKFNLEAYDFAPENEAILDNLGYNYYLINDLKNAENTYRKLFEINSKPKFAEAYYNYGLVTLALNKNEEAKTLFEKALASQFSNITALKKEEVEEKLKSIS